MLMVEFAASFYVSAVFPLGVEFRFFLHPAAQISTAKDANCHRFVFIIWYRMIGLIINKSF